MVNENYGNFTKTRPNKDIHQPDEPKNHRKEREEGKGARAREKKRLAKVFSSYSVDFRDDLVFKNPGRYGDSSIESSGDEKIPNERFGLIHVSENFGYVRDVPWPPPF